jgi:hypothetical protein
MRSRSQRFVNRAAFVLTCLALVASVDAGTRSRPPVRPPQNPQPQNPQEAGPDASAAPRRLPPVRPRQVGPSIVRIDGVAYRVTISVTRVIPGILADGQDIDPRPSVRVTLARVDGRPINRPIGVPMLQLGHPGDAPSTVELSPLVDMPPTLTTTWIGTGDERWTDDVQLRARLAIPSSRGLVRLNTVAQLQVVALP